MLTKINDNDAEQSIEKIHVSNSRRRTKDGREFIYKNYLVSMPNKYGEAMNIMDKIFLYSYGSKIHVTSVQPDGSVRAKRLSIYPSIKGNEGKTNKRKRFFIIPKYFFPNVKESDKVVFSLNMSEIEQFSKVNATLTMDII